jgi:hypothetical protein
MNWDTEKCPYEDQVDAIIKVKSEIQYWKYNSHNCSFRLKCPLCGEVISVVRDAGHIFVTCTTEGCLEWTEEGYLVP